MFNIKRKEDFEKYRYLFEMFDYSYELTDNCIIINNRWSFKIIISFTSREFGFTIESTDEGKDMVIYEWLLLALNEIAKEYNK